MIVIFMIALPILVGILLAMLTNSPDWIVGAALLEWLIYTIWSGSQSNYKHKEYKDIDDYTNENGWIRWWHDK